MNKPKMTIETGKIYNEDCMETMARMEDNNVDLLLTDIPYGVVNRVDSGLRNLNKEDADTITFEIKEFVNEICRIVGGSLYVFCGIEQVSELFEEFDNEMITRHCVWSKNNPSPINGKKMWLSGHENFIFAKKSGAFFNRHCESSVVEFNAGSSKIHPTQKPLDLWSYLIESSSEENDLVYDPCIGSGTTAVACEKSNRRWIGSEISEEYCEIARERIKIEKDQGKLF